MTRGVKSVLAQVPTIERQETDEVATRRVTGDRNPGRVAAILSDVFVNFAEAILLRDGSLWVIPDCQGTPAINSQTFPVSFCRPVSKIWPRGARV